MANRYPLQPPQGMKRQQRFPSQLQQTVSAEQVQKQREYLKQQQKLRLMAAASHKGNTISTETLIENLLGSKETFQPVEASMPSGLFTSAPRPSDTTHGQAHMETMQAAWLSPKSPLFPPQYHQVWSLVGLPDGMVDTAKIYPLLLTSGLHTDVLGFIWGLSNRQVPGTLTEQELYVLLALVALAQNGYSFNSASVLNLVPQPPVPNLNLGSEPQQPLKQEHNFIQPVISHQSVASSSTVVVANNQNVAPPTSVQYDQPVFGQFSQGSSFTTTASTNQCDADDFTDFQSASIPSSSISFAQSQAEIPTKQSKSDVKSVRKSVSELPLSSPPFNKQADKPPVEKPAFVSHDTKHVPVQKFPTVAVVGGGRSIGSRLANHSLSTPKLTKGKHHKHHHHHHRSVPPEPASVSVDEEFSDFQQASLDDVSESSLSQPHSSHTYLLKESAIRVNDTRPVLKIREPSTVKPSVLDSKENQIGSIAPPPVPTPGTTKKISEDTGVLMSVEEDKYSALRALSACNESSTAVEEEYGDFFSATVTSNDESFAAIAVRDTSAVVDQVVPPWGTMEPVEPQTSKFEVDDWNLFMSAEDSSQDSKTTIRSMTTKPTAASNADLKSDSRTESNADMFSSQVADLNLKSHKYSTPLHSEKASTPQSSLNNPSGQNIMSLFNETSSPLTSQQNVDSCSNNQNIDDDDFGDFVSPDSFSTKVSISDEKMGSLWSEEVKETDNQSVNKLWLDESKGIENHLWSSEGIKYDQIKLSKDGMLDNPLVSNLWLEEGKAMDSQSVRSLELPGLEQAWDSVGEWRRCVQSCVSVLQFAVDTFESITEPKVMQEVLTSSEGQEYLKGLVEVWAVCERLALSYRQSGTDHKLDALLNSAETMWVSLKQYYQQAQVTTESEETVEGGELCGICLVGGAKLEFGGRTYHPSCGNLWLNLVDTTGLPALHPSCT